MKYNITCNIHYKNYPFDPKIRKNMSLKEAQKQLNLIYKHFESNQKILEMLLNKDNKVKLMGHEFEIEFEIVETKTENK